MRYKAIFVGGPLDGQERVTEQPVSEVCVRGPRTNGPLGMESTIYRYTLLFGYGENTLIYSTKDTAATLDLLLESYMEEANETIF